MKNLVFESIWILSQRDQRARKVEFHPRKNLLVGKNHTGKSSLIKTIYFTLGATPAGKLEIWDPSTISLLSFRVNGGKFSVLRQMGFRALFNADGNLMGTASSSEDWAALFANIVGFNLVMARRIDNESILASPSCFFLPFYIDQDGSWTSDWDTFSGLKQFSSPHTSILEYFSGVKPPEYYQKQAEKKKSQQELEAFTRELSFLNKAKARVEKTLAFSGAKTNPENFENEIRSLTKEVTHLNSLQENVKEEIVKSSELVTSLELQINLATCALEIYDKDRAFLSDAREKLVCPTCHAEHSENFLSLFDFAENARVLSSLKLQLSFDYKEALKKYEASKNKLTQLSSQYEKVSEILEARKGELEFKDVVNGMSSEHALSAFLIEANELQKVIDEKTLEIAKLNGYLAELTSIARSKKIYGIFREAFRSALSDLNLPPRDVSKIRITTRPSVSGSGGPRLVLAYYSALWAVCSSEYGSFSVPLVIDSPNQQGQDDINLPKVLEFIADKLPHGSQIIVGSEIDTTHEFDKRIFLTEKYKFLEESKFDEVQAIIDPLIKMMEKDLSSKDNLE